MFPSTDVSQYNSVAPIVTDDVVECFKADNKLRDELLLNLYRILDFWDFSVSVGNDLVTISLKPEFMVRIKNRS